MFAMTRRQARMLRALARRSIAKGGPRPPAPAVTFVSGPAGPVAFAAVGPVTVGCRLAKGHGPAEAVSIPLSALAACEGSDLSPVRVEPADAGVRLTWSDRGQPRSETVPAVAVKDAVPPEVPEPFPEVGHAFLTALHEAGRCAEGRDTRYTLERLHVRGRAGQVIGTDGRHALVLGGFRLPFADDVLVPAVPVFGLKELSREGPVRVGRTEDGLCVGVGDWLVWLAADPDGRFPDVDGVVRRTAGGTRLRIGDDDAAKLVAELPKLPRADDEYAPVTVTVNATPGLTAGAVRVRLADSEAAGPAAVWTVNRAYLHRALLLGFRDFSTKTATGNLVAVHGDHTYLFALLDADPPAPETPEAPKAVTKPERPQAVSRGASPEAGRRPEPPSDVGEPDVSAEAETLRTLLGNAASQAARLAGLLKDHGRQRKAVQSALSSLQHLNLGAGG